jgi:hypothetical protein
MVKRHTRHRRQKSTRRRTRKMHGGAFSQDELQQLRDQQFTQNQIQILSDIGITFNEIMQKLNTITHSGNVNQDDIPEQVVVELLNENIFENPNANDMIPHAEDDIHHMDDNDLDLSMDQSQGSLHLSHLIGINNSMDGNTTLPDESLGASQISDISLPSNISENTTLPDESLGASQISDISLPSNISENESFASETGGKKRRRKTQRKSKKGKKGKKGKKTRKQRGGMCYGNGVGANSYDPNYSIYNTRLLELFPYRPK